MLYRVSFRYWHVLQSAGRGCIFALITCNLHVRWSADVPVTREPGTSSFSPPLAFPVGQRCSTSAPAGRERIVVLRVFFRKKAITPARMRPGRQERRFLAGRKIFDLSCHHRGGSSSLTIFFPDRLAARTMVVWKRPLLPKNFLARDASLRF